MWEFVIKIVYESMGNVFIEWNIVYWDCLDIGCMWIVLCVGYLWIREVFLYGFVKFCGIL